MSAIQWWGYRHTNGTIHTKRYFDKRDIEEANESPFVDQSTGPFEAGNADDARNIVFARLAQKGRDYQRETVNPSWIKPSMTVEQAAKAASMRNCTLKASFDKTFGVRIISVRREL